MTNEDIKTLREAEAILEDLGAGSRDLEIAKNKLREMADRLERERDDGR